MKKLNIIIAAGLAIMSLACQKTEDYVIESNPDLFAAYPIAQVAGRDGGDVTLNITGTEAWTLTVESSVAANWCRPDITEGSGAATVTFATDPATSPANMRNVMIYITAGEKVIKAKISQETLLLGDNEVLIDGLIWATANVGEPGTFVDSPDEIGMYYQFNRKVGYPSSGPKPDNWPASYVSDGHIDWQPENDPCPEGYRMCTGAEFNALAGINDDGKLSGTRSYWVNPSDKNGFARPGFIFGISPEVAKGATKETLKSLGGIFVPKSGWRTGDGNIDRDWLVCVRTSTSLDERMGGLFLSDTGYTDCWGWGDGQKERASAVRCIRNIIVTE